MAQIVGIDETDGAVILQMKQTDRFYVIESYPYHLIYCKGHNVPLPFKYISKHNAFAAAHDLNTGKETVASMYYCSFIAGCRPRSEKPLTYSEWLKKYEKNFEHWYQ